MDQIREIFYRRHMHCSSMALERNVGAEPEAGICSGSYLRFITSPATELPKTEYRSNVGAVFASNNLLV